MVVEQKHMLNWGFVVALYGKENDKNPSLHIIRLVWYGMVYECTLAYTLLINLINDAGKGTNNHLELSNPPSPLCYVFVHFEQ